MDRIDVTPFPVQLSVCLKEDDWDRAMRKLGSGEEFPTWAGCTVAFDEEDGNRYLIVTFSSNFKTDPLYKKVGLIAHESAHCWQLTAEHIGSADADEIEAHSIQWFSKMITQELAKRRWM